MHGTRRISGVMGMSERDQTRYWRDIGSEKWRVEYKDFNKFLAWLFATTVFIFFVWMVYRALFSIFGVGWNEFEEMTASFRNLALIVVGAFGFPFAVWRVKLADDQVKLAKKDGEDKERERVKVEKRKEKDDRHRDRERVEERLEGAVRLLAEPTDSMKHFAITQLEQIATEHLEQTLPSVINCLCGQAKEYDPQFGEGELQRIKRDALGMLYKEHTDANAGWLKMKTYYRENTEEEIETAEKSAIVKALQKGRENRTHEMVKKLVESVNRLALKIESTNPETQKRQNDESAALFDLRGVEIFSTTIRNITVTPDRFAGCEFHKVIFVGCTFIGKFDKSTNFVNCRFIGGKFGAFDFSEADFKGSSFSGSGFFGSTFWNVSWTACPFGETEFWNVKISQNSVNIFSKCNMTSASFVCEDNRDYKQARKELPDDLRWNFFSTDFEKNYVTKGRKFPSGLKQMIPSIGVKEGQISQDGTLQLFSVVPIEESQ